MNLFDFAKRKGEEKEVEDYFNRYSFRVVLWPDAWKNAQVGPRLNWRAVDFGRHTKDAVPAEPGVYAFSISIRNTIMPPHGVLVYFGKSARTLRERYGEYLRDAERGSKRIKLEHLFNFWKDDLEFHFAPVPDPQWNLRDIEIALNDAVVPHCVTQDFSAQIKQAVNAFRNRT